MSSRSETTSSIWSLRSRLMAWRAFSEQSFAAVRSALEFTCVNVRRKSFSKKTRPFPPEESESTRSADARGDCRGYGSFSVPDRSHLAGSHLRWADRVVAAKAGVAVRAEHRAPSAMVRVGSRRFHRRDRAATVPDSRRSNHMRTAPWNSFTMRRTSARRFARRVACARRQ